MNEYARVWLGVCVAWFLCTLIFGATLERAMAKFGDRWPVTFADLFTYILTPIIVGGVLGALVVLAKAAER